jgi:molybdopterin synthase catalytic subunit
VEIHVRLFASLRLDAKTDAIRVDLPHGATVADALEKIRETHTNLAPWLPSCRVAIGLDFADPNRVLKQGDDVALIPPVQGGCPKDESQRTVILTTKPVEEIMNTVLHLDRHRLDAEGGAIVEFWGVVRGTEEGEPISGIEYEAYPEMAEHQMHRILEDLEGRLPLHREIVIHRTGVVPVGESSLYVRIEASHRREAFVACQSFIDQLKRDVPVWKHPKAKE